MEKLETVNIALSEEEKMKLRGRIDRIDICEDEGHVYVKVVDYKSGSKKFNLAALSSFPAKASRASWKTFPKSAWAKLYSSRSFSSPAVGG